MDVSYVKKMETYTKHIHPTRHCFNILKFNNPCFYGVGEYKD